MQQKFRCRSVSKQGEIFKVHLVNDGRNTPQDVFLNVETNKFRQGHLYLVMLTELAEPGR